MPAEKKPGWWGVLAREGVKLATSYYSDCAGEHDAITTRPGSYERTRANVTQAVSRGIPLRVGIVSVLPGQRVTEAQRELEALGVTTIRTDRTRRVGRASLPTAGADPAELCGRCGHGQVAVLPTGEVTPCVMSRWLTTGNVRERGLAAILGGEAWAEALRVIPAHANGNPCDPDCNPASDGGEGRYPVLNVTEAWDVRAMLELAVPGVETYYEERGEQRTAWLVHADGSWARASARWIDAPTVHQGGPQRLWTALERIRHRLNAEGGLPIYGSRVNITSDGVCHFTRGKWSATYG